MAGIDLRSSTPQSGAYEPALVAPVVADGTTDNATSINTTLTAAASAGGGKVVIPAGGRGVVLVGASLLIPSNTTLYIGPGVTVKLKNGANVPVVRNSDFSGGNSNVGLIGAPGATIDYNGANQSVSGNRNTFATDFQNVTGLTIRGLKVNNANKYAIGVAVGSNLTVDDITFATNSDGLHIQGPYSRAHVTNLKGTTGDDFCVVGTTDYAAYLVGTGGDVTGVTVTGLYPASALCAFKAYGDTTYKADRVTVRGVFGATTTNGIYLGDGKLGSIHVEDIAVTNAANAMVLVNPSVASDRISIRGLTWRSGANASAGVLNIVPTATLSELTVRDVHICGVLASLDVIQLGGTITHVLLDSIVAVDSPTSINLVEATSTANIDTLTFRDCRVKGGDANSKAILCAAGGTLNVVNFSNCKFVGSSLASINSGGGTGWNVEVVNTWISGSGQLIFTTLPIEIDLSNVYTAVTTAIIRVSGSGTARIKGNAVRYTGGVAGLTRTASQACSVNNPGFPVDVTILTPTDGDLALNTNAGAGCGVGATVYNTAAAKWKNLYTGLTT